MLKVNKNKYLSLSFALFFNIIPSSSPNIRNNSKHLRGFHYA